MSNPNPFDPNSINIGWVHYDRSDEHPERGRVVKDFYNRERTKERILAHLKSGNPVPVVLIGAPRSGKTSMLRLIDDRLSYFTPDFASVVIPHQEINSRRQLADSILESVRAEVLRLNPDASLDPLDARAGLNVVTQFVHELRFLLKQIPGRKMAICIDELDSIVKAAGDNQPARAEGARDEGERAPDFGREVINLVRALMDHHPLPVSLLVSMYRVDESRSYVMEFCGKSQLIYLQAFAESDCRELAGDLLGPSFGASDADMLELCRLSGGWPYFIKLILSHVDERPPKPNWLALALKRAVESEVAEYSIREMYKKDFDSHDKTIVLMLVRNDGPVTMAEIEAANPALQKAELEKALQNLINRNFVAREGERYSLRPGFLKEWFRNWTELPDEIKTHLNPAPWAVAAATDEDDSAVVVTDEDLKDWDIF